MIEFKPTCVLLFYEIGKANDQSNHLMVSDQHCLMPMDNYNTTEGFIRLRFFSGLGQVSV